MHSTQTVSSLFLMAPPLAKYEGMETLIGYVTVGEEVTGGTTCAEIYDSGFYTCSEPLNGRYITFYSTLPDDNIYNYDGDDGKYEMMLQQFKAFPSANLIATATLEQEPTLMTDYGSENVSYSNYMSTLNPRGFVVASDVDPVNCSRYNAGTGDFVFKMAEKTYVDYVLLTSEPEDGNA